MENYYVKQKKESVFRMNVVYLESGHDNYIWKNICFSKEFWVIEKRTKQLNKNYIF